MKVAIVINELDIRGGTHKQVLRLCEYLVGQNIEVKIFTKCYDRDKTYPGFSQFEIITPDESLIVKYQNAHRWKRNRAFEKNLFRKMDKDIDIINVHDNGLIYFMLLCKIHHKAKVVWQVNDLPGCFGVGNVSNVKNGIKNRLHRLFSRLAANSVDRITVNVTKNKKLVEKCYKRDAEVLYCGVDENTALLKHSFRQKEVCNILSGGVFFPYRNYETLVSVMEKLREIVKKVHLDIIGSTDLSPEYYEKIVSIIEEKGLTEYITIHGQVSEDEYNRLHNVADIFMFININQSWGLAVFEAMSCGLPVIVSNSVGAIELLHDGQDSIIADPVNADILCEYVLKLMTDEKYYNFISENAYNAVKEFTWDKLYSSNMLKIFNELTVGKGK